MAEIYGHRWTSSYGDNPNEGAALTWAKGLGGIEPRQLANGLRACIASAEPWPPTLPEFRAMCLGIPTFAEARSLLMTEQRGGESRHPFLVLTFRYIDTYRYRQVSAEQSDRMLREAYELAREHVMRGGALPEPAAGEITQEKREIQMAERDAAARARDALWGKTAAAGPDAA